MKPGIQRRCIIASVLFSFFFWNCKKTYHDNRFDGSIQLKLSTEGLEYVQLGLGKYFIYKDSSNGKLDSVVVTKSVVENIFSPALNGGLYAAYNSEVFSLTLTKIDVGIQTLWFEAKNDPALCCPSSSADNEPIIMSDIMYGTNTISFYYPVCNCDLSTGLPDLTVEGKVYNNVIRTIGVSGTDPSSSDYIRIVTYWAKGVGIIKRTRTIISGTQTYILTRNN